MRVLVLGHNGYLGSYLVDNLKCSVDTMSVPYIEDNYEYVINCIGKPNLEYCEHHPDISRTSNYNAIYSVLKTCPRAKVINFSSYYVYNDEGLCTEESNVTDKYIYCKHKLMSEELITDRGGVTFRLGKLFGNSKKDQGKLTDAIIVNTDMILDEVMFNPTSVRQVLRAVNYEIKFKDLKGVFNLSNSGTVSHYDYGVFIRETLDMSTDNLKRIKKTERVFDHYGRFEMSIDKISKKVRINDWKKDMEYYLDMAEIHMCSVVLVHYLSRFLVLDNSQSFRIPCYLK